MEDLHQYFKDKTGIEIPHNILKHYLNGKNSNSQFTRLFKSQIDSLNPCLSILISEKFAVEILKLIHEYSFEERTTYLFKEISNHHKYTKDLIFDNPIEEFVIEEILYSIIDYDFKENRFKFPLIQKAYLNLNSNIVELKVILILYGHCGGEGGIIVRGKNLGYDIGYSHTEISEIEFNGRLIEYKGFNFEGYEMPHKPISENQIR